MVGWIILGVIVGLIVLLLVIPIGADIAYEGGELRVSAKVCGILLQLIPKEPEDESAPKKEKKPKKERKPKKEKPPKEPKPKKKLELDFSFDEIMALLKAVTRGFGRFGKLTVDRFLLHFTAAGDDPYNTAVMYNYVNAGLSVMAPICRNKFNVKSGDVWTDVDFTKDKMEVDFGLCVVIRLCQIFRMVFAIAFGALWILIKHKVRKLIDRFKHRKDPKPEPEKAEEPSPEALPENKDNKNEDTTQQDERMNNDGK